jgi:sulfite exporter TauE/SafE
MVILLALILLEKEEDKYQTTLLETVRNPNGLIMTSNEFTKQFLTTFKPDITGKYTITVYNLGNSPVSVGVLVGNLPFVGTNNQVNLNFLGEIIAGVFLIITGIIVLIAGVIVLALDKRRVLPKTHKQPFPHHLRQQQQKLKK